MTESGSEQFAGFEHNKYQNGMHGWSYISLWTIIVLGVAAGIFGFIWGLTH